MSSPCEVGRWLRDAGLSRYLSDFLDQGYDDLATCAQIEEPDLDALGLADPADRARTVCAVHRLRRTLARREHPLQPGGSGPEKTCPHCEAIHRRPSPPRGREGSFNPRYWDRGRNISDVVTVSFSPKSSCHGSRRARQRKAYSSSRRYHAPCTKRLTMDEGRSFARRDHIPHWTHLCDGLSERAPKDSKADPSPPTLLANPSASGGRGEDHLVPGHYSLSSCLSPAEKGVIYDQPPPPPSGLRSHEFKDKKGPGIIKMIKNLFLSRKPSSEQSPDVTSSPPSVQALTEIQKRMSRPCFGAPPEPSSSNNPETHEYYEPSDWNPETKDQVHVISQCNHCNVGDSDYASSPFEVRRRPRSHSVKSRLTPESSDSSEGSFVVNSQSLRRQKIHADQRRWSSQEYLQSSVPQGRVNLPVMSRGRALVHSSASPYDMGGLNFKKGDIINILAKCHSGLWLGEVKGQVGYFKFIDIEEIKGRAESCSKLRQQGRPHHPGSIRTLLKESSLQDYLSVLALNGFDDPDTFKEMEEEDLDLLRITTPHHRIRLLQLAQALRGCPGCPDCPGVSHDSGLYGCVENDSAVVGAEESHSDSGIHSSSSHNPNS